MKKHPLLAFILFFTVIFFVGVTVMYVMVTASTGNKPSFVSKQVAIVEIEGPIFQSTDVLKDLREIEEDDNIKALVVRLDSPGGAVAPSQEIFRELKAIKKTKPVVASMGSVAASGAYYIACAADKIVASPGTITGSIGVIMESFGLQELIKKVSVESRVVKSGAFKDIGNPFRDMTEDDRAFLQTLSDDVYQQFVTDVSEMRGIALADMPNIAEGRVFSGRQALELKLVDEMGNYFDAIQLAKKLADLPDDAAVQWPREESPFQKFFKGEGAHSALDLLMDQLRNQKQLPLFFFNQSALPVYK